MIKEDVSKQADCPFCSEQDISLGKKTSYGSVIIYKTGKNNQDGWFATLSPKTGSNPKEDFTLQLMPKAHLTHFSQIASKKESAKNFGIAFSELTKAMTKIMAEKKELKSIASTRDKGIAICTYGKCTTWKDKKEHLHIKIFPFRGNIGQPFTVDSSFGKKPIYKDSDTKKEYIKMKPVKKLDIDHKHFQQLTDKLLSFFKKQQK